MCRFLLLLLFISGSISLWSQSIHGNDFKMDCAACHTSDSWEIPAESWDFKDPEERGEPNSDTLKFNHYNTIFPLTGQHKTVDCRDCHETLIFEEANEACISCHTDIHYQTVGSDCARCHTSEHWLIDNITELHHDNGFPLLGAHNSVSCSDCHISESELQFPRIGNDCINCHLDDYQATIAPNHMDAGYSLECTDCHDIEGFDWSSENINHDFFPLTDGHDIADCLQCHVSGDFTVPLSNDCIVCHQSDYDNTLNPNHQSLNFPADCKLCHSTEIGWPADDFTAHDDNYFPIFSGKHNNEWNDCIECHTTPGDFTMFSCIDCHEHDDPGDLADEHDEVGDYEYSSPACYSCHPTGEE